MERWKNLAAFWAQQSSSPSIDHSKYALEAFQDALEPLGEGEQAGNREFLLQTACIWLVCGIEWIWRRIQGNVEGWASVKWEQWKQSLEDCRDIYSGDETITLVREALLVMAKAEQGQSL